jgi:hypothetical protein
MLPPEGRLSARASGDAPEASPREKVLARGAKLRMARAREVRGSGDVSASRVEANACRTY